MTGPDARNATGKGRHNRLTCEIDSVAGCARKLFDTSDGRKEQFQIIPRKGC